MIKTLLLEEFSLLTFRPVSSAVPTHWAAFLAFGLVFTWLEHVVFAIMGGLRPEDHSANDGAYLVVIWLSILSVLLIPVLVIAYAMLAYLAWRKD